jgi:predicted outer membrane repeat protein
MSLTGSSKLTLHKYAETVYSQNHAKTNGGAIYFADKTSINQCGVYDNTTISLCFQPNTTITETCKRQDDCFIELDADFPFNHSTTNISLIFLDNYAGKSGAVMFGGSLDNCRLYLGGGFQDSCGNKIGREYKESALQTLLQISTIDNMSLAISSEPFRVCFCDDNGVPDCESNISISIVRGEVFTLSAVTVGQVNFTVPSSVKADFGNSSSTTLNRLQRVQDTGNTCTNLFYRLFSAENSITMILFPDGPCRDTGIARREVIVTFLPCPDGFILIDTECKCDRKLSAFNVSCNVDTRTIKREENNFWMMAIYDNSSYQGLLLHNARCPFDFCVETAVEINLKDPDIQCNHNHSGILCGSCRDNFSLALGTLHCLPCSNTYLALIPALALAGIALVLFLLLLQLTVAYGTINGLVFYANVVQVNRDIFFPPGDTNILTVFIAWLNLDLGIETCFYDGMNAYAFIWLQFVFPFYVWFLIGFIIFLSRYSLRISRLLRNNPVSVLATLFLLSYSKILRTIIAALSRTALQYPDDGSYQYVWLYDGSVPYFQRIDHILLGIFAISSLLFLFLPYTILLFTSHWLQAHSDWKVFSWIK